jgi:hypothetical protein
VVDVQKREDRFLDQLGILYTKRADTLRQIELWRETDPSLSEVLDDIKLRLL